MPPEKIKKCVTSKKDKNFKIIARSDAKNVEGLDKMIDRCKAYIDAGAEIIFPEALKNENEFELEDEPKAGHDTHAPAGNQAITIGKA